jgi:hypothetical protein
MSTTALVIILIVASAVAVVPLLSYVGSRQRRAVMSYATTQGWQYRDDDPALAMRYWGHPFVSDSDARAEAVIRGRFSGMPFAAYAYTANIAGADATGRATNTTRTVPVVSLLLGSGLPDLDVVPGPSFDASWGEHSPFELSPDSAEFREAFTVRTANRQFASDVLQPRLMHDLMAYPERAWAIRGGDVISVGSWNGKPEKIPTYLDHLTMIVDAVPPSVWTSYGGRPERADSGGGRSDQPNNSST